MPIHDWSRVDTGIFHHFHQRWIGALTDVLNQRLLPAEYDALAERQGASRPRDPGRGGTEGNLAGDLLTAWPQVCVAAESDLEFYRRKQNVVAVPHAPGDRLVAVIEVVSKGNRSGRKALDDFVRKAVELLSRGVHLLILDLQPPTSRDPQGIHGAV